ncbi:MAG: cupin domain-containing protein [Candidatus Micrarchaeota archaeon]
MALDIIVRKPTPQEIEESKNWGDWGKSPSEFEWSYDEKETCYILEGNATVKPEGGKEVSFEAGDLVIFPKGMNCTWKIEKTIKKKYKFG